MSKERASFQTRLIILALGLVMLVGGKREWISLLGLFFVVYAVLRIAIVDIWGRVDRR